MCGIVALFNSKKEINKKIIERSIVAMNHRGPDASGTYFDEKGLLGLGNNRLAFVDPKKRSDQPLEVNDYVITFNGEIYNYRDLKKQLQKSGYIFRTESDTEVLIHAISAWGTKALFKFNGCFAFILYNKKTGKVLIARDRLGEKQLVYTKAKNGDHMFASEVKGLLVHPDISSKLNLDRCIGTLIFNIYTDPSETFFDAIFEFPPGHFCEFDLHGQTNLLFKKYWDLSDIQIKDYTAKDIPELIVETKDFLCDAVRLQIPENLPIGSILSGGLDSSFISGLATSMMPQAMLHCFTIGYNGVVNRDLDNARLLATSYPSIQLHEIIMKKSDVIEHEKIVMSALEEPPTDTALHSMYENYKSAKEIGLKCVFNGQGSDEQWLGYLHADPIFGMPRRTYKRGAFARYWYDSSYFTDYIKDSVMKKKVKEIIEKNLEKNFYGYAQEDHYDTLTRFALKTHLVHLLHQEDRLSMSNSIEIRLPFLDTRLIELALSIPASIKKYDGREKFILRKAAEGIIPKAIIQRKKQGFPNAPHSYDKVRSLSLKPEDKKYTNKSDFMKMFFGDNTKKLSSLPMREQQIPQAIAQFQTHQTSEQ